MNCFSPGPTLTRLGDNLRGLPAVFPWIVKRIPYPLARDVATFEQFSNYMFLTREMLTYNHPKARCERSVPA